MGLLSGLKSYEFIFIRFSEIFRVLVSFLIIDLSAVLYLTEEYFSKS